VSTQQHQHINTNHQHKSSTQIINISPQHKSSPQVLNTNFDR
jgi:hypothetical protein